MKPDRLSELFRDVSFQEIVDLVGPDETVEIRIAREKGIKLTRRPNITFWQAVIAVTWFPILGAVIAAFLWSRDQNSVVIRYATEHLSVTVTGLFGAWLLSGLLMARLFRYIRNS